MQLLVLLLLSQSCLGLKKIYTDSCLCNFEVKVDMHQGSGLSPLLFVIVMEAISREFRVALPWELLNADDLAVIAETEEELIKRLNEWKDMWRVKA